VIAAHRQNLACGCRFQNILDMSFDALRSQIFAFRDERDWDQFHHPKELAIALSIEASELLEHFLWKNPTEVSFRIESKREEIADELADVAVYLIELADKVGVDLETAIQRKLAKNALKYPVEKARGSNKKYSELADENAPQ
jgi:NTP pyrophosphatase (non-canonical NTP hydrolase)